MPRAQWHFGSDLLPFGRLRLDGAMWVLWFGLWPGLLSSFRPLARHWAPGSVTDMDAWALLQLARGAEEDPPECVQDAVRVWRLAGRRHCKTRRNMAAKNREIKMKTVQMKKQARAQMIRFNSRGMARTQDHVMVDPNQAMAKAGRPQVRGSGAWKCWTFESVCRAAFAAPDRTARSVVADSGGGPASAVTSRWAVARSICRWQSRVVKRLAAGSKQAGCKLPFVITNNMFDATTLEVKCPSPFLRSVFARHSQITWQNLDGVIQDMDIVQPPRVLSHYTADVCWSALTGEEYIGSILPSTPVKPLAQFYGTLTAMDSHSVNKKVLQSLLAKLPPASFHLATFCLQHKTGHVMEAVTKHLRIIGSCFCIAKQFHHGNFLESMKQKLRVIVEEELQVVKPGDVRAADLNTEFGKALLKQCFVHSHEDDEVQAPGHAVSDQVCARQEDADKFAEFFPTLWRGAGPVLEEGRACRSVFVQGSVSRRGRGERVVSVVLCAGCHFSHVAARSTSPCLPGRVLWG